MASTSKIYSYLLDIQTKCFEFSKTHSDKSDHLSRSNTILNITNIVITSSVATLTTTFSQLNKDENINVTIAIVSSVVLYLSAVINSVQQFLNLEKLSEINKLTSLRYVKLGNNIKRFLAVEELQHQDIVEYFKWVSSTYEEILSNSNTSSHQDSIIDGIKLPSDSVFANENEVVGSSDNILDINFENSIRHDNIKGKMKYEIDRWGVDSIK